MSTYMHIYKCIHMYTSIFIHPYMNIYSSIYMYIGCLLGFECDHLLSFLFLSIPFFCRYYAPADYFSIYL